MSRKYLKVTMSGRYGDETHYVPLEPGTEYSQDDLMRIGQDLVNEVCSWGIGEELLDEDEIPKGER